MKITKYPQSCLLVEKAGQRLMIDPGSFFASQFDVGQLDEIQAVLYTHQHADHFEPALVDRLMARGVKLYGNADVVGLIGTGAIRVHHGQDLVVAGFNIRPHDLPHCRLTDGSEGPPNTGYIIDGNFFHPGDGIQTQGVTVDNLAVPIAGPTIDHQRALQFALSVGAKRVIPIHFTNPAFPTNARPFVQLAQAQMMVVLLADGDSTELS